MCARVIVIGGGPAGMMAAGRAAELGATVTLLEKNPRLGAKLRITGAGRCNLTNATSLAAFMEHLGPDPYFMRNAFARFFAPELLAFFHDLGLRTVTERGSRVFPASQRAVDVVVALQRYCQDNNVVFRYWTDVRRILARGDNDLGVRLDDQILEADAVVLATGGASYPTTGSTGDGYRIAQELGHTVAPARPGLVPLVSDAPWIPELEGLSLRNVQGSIYQGDKLLASEFGEMVFTADGVSGPIILTLSVRLGDALDAGPLRLVIDLKPALDVETLDARLRRDLDEMGKAHYIRLLKGLLPSKLIPVFGKRSGVRRDQKLSEMNAEQRGQIRDLLKSFDMTITGTRSLNEAIVTLGGVATREIDPRTMESRCVPGLFFAGEVMDVHGDTGGYNLQVAFTTGRLAGENAARVGTAGAGATGAGTAGAGAARA